MATFNEAINAMVGTKTSIDEVILHKCMMLDDSKLTMDNMLNALRIFYPEVQEHYYDLHEVNKYYK